MNNHHGKHLFASITLGILGLSLIPATPSMAATFGTNLIKNPGAEAGVGSSSKPQVVNIPSWTKSGKFTAVQYGLLGDGPGDFLAANSPGPNNRGKNFFSGGPTNKTSSISQTINFSGTSDLAAIDTGKVGLTLSGWFGGKTTQKDYAQLDATFLDKNGKSLKTFTVGKVTPQQRNNLTSLLFRQTTAKVPSGSRKVDLKLSAVWFDGKYNQGFADNLSLTLTAPSKSLSSEGLSEVTPTATPEPASIAGLLAIGGMAVASRRKKQQAQQQ